MTEALGFEFRIILQSDWLPIKLTEPSLTYYFIYEYRVKRLIHAFHPIIITEDNCLPRNNNLLYLSHLKSHPIITNKNHCFFLKKGLNNKKKI